MLNVSQQSSLEAFSRWGADSLLTQIVPFYCCSHKERVLVRLRGSLWHNETVVVLSRLASDDVLCVKVFVLCRFYTSLVFLLLGKVMFRWDGRYQTFCHFVEECESEISSSFLQCLKFKIFQHLSHDAVLSRGVVLCNESSCSALSSLQLIYVFFVEWVPYGG